MRTYVKANFKILEERLDEKLRMFQETISTWDKNLEETISDWADVEGLTTEIDWIRRKLIKQSSIVHEALATIKSMKNTSLHRTIEFMKQSLIGRFNSHDRYRKWSKKQKINPENAIS